MKRISILVLPFFLAISACGQSPNDQKDNEIPIEISNSYDHEVIVTDLINPWGIVFLPDGSMLITEKEGKLIHFSKGEKIEVSGVPEVYNRGQGGLLDIQLSPNYSEDCFLYITYSSNEGEGKGGNTALMRAKLEDNQLIYQKVLYKASPNTTKGQHFGSRIAFDTEGHVFFSAGERGERDINPQDLTRDNGKIYRLNLDNTIWISRKIINFSSCS